MSSHRIANRLFPPVVVLAVVGGVWYAAVNRVDSPSTRVASAATASPTHAKVANQQATPLEVPTVQKLDGQVQFSFATKQTVQVQKVEFYVGKKFMGTAFSSPYTLSIDENNLQPGSYEVVAKVFTDSSTTETPPANFVAEPTNPVAPSSSTAENATTATPTPAPPATNGATTAPTPTTPSAPTPVQAVAADDSSSVSVSWTAAGGGSEAVSYQVLRDGVTIATPSGTSYTDGNVTPGTTYHYQIIAVDAAGHSSPPSEVAAVTVPNPAAPNSGADSSRPAVENPESPQE